MRKILLPLTAIYLASFLLYAGNGLFITSAGLKLYEMGVDSVLIGFVNSSFFAGFVIGSIFAISFLQKVGHIRGFCFFTSLFVFGILVHALNDNIYSWIGFRVMLGFANSGILMILESWLNEKSETSYRSRVLSFYSLTFYLAYLVSVYILGLNLEISEIFIISAVFSLISVFPVSLTKIKEPKLEPIEGLSFPNLINIVPLALLGSFISGIVLNGFFTMSSVYILKIGYGASEVAFFLGSGILGGFLIQIPMGKISDSYGRRNSILGTSCLAFMASCALFYTENIHIQYTASFFLGVGIFTFYALSLARANDVLEDSSKIVEVNQALLLSYGIGSLISPVLLGFLLDSFGKYGFIGIFQITTIILFIFALTKDVVPISQRSVYVPIVGDTSSIAATMDIRDENDAKKIEELQNSETS